MKLLKAYPGMKELFFNYILYYVVLVLYLIEAYDYRLVSTIVIAKLVYATLHVPVKIN